MNEVVDDAAYEEYMMTTDDEERVMSEFLGSILWDVEPSGDDLPYDELADSPEEGGETVEKADKPLKDPKGGLTSAGRKAFGGNLKPGVKNYDKASEADKKRWVSWALRFYGQKDYPPLKKPNGEPTRFALTAAAWGEKVPETEADARAIAIKARRRSAELKGLKPKG